MGIGPWKGRQNWPDEVSWMKVVTEMKIFGFTICSTYQQTLTKTWEKVVRGFEQVLFSWESRQLETLSQRVQVARTFALSKLYYVAQVLPLPGEHRRKVESRLSSFIFRGRHERLKLSELENTCENGGLGLPNLSVKADSLLIKQMCRMMNLPNEKSFHLMGYWLGWFLRDTGLGENFPELYDIGPVSQTMSGRYPLHQYMLDTFIEAVGRGEVGRINDPMASTVQRDAALRVGQQAAQLAGRGDAWDQQHDAAQGGDRQDDVPVRQRGTSILKSVTTKAIYISRMTDLLVPPKVELKFPQVNFPELVYGRVNHRVLETKQRDVNYAIIHGIYKNRHRLLQQHRVDDSLCSNQACRRSDMDETVEHIFSLCFKVRTAWLWLREKVIEMMSDQGPAPAISNTELLMFMYPGCRKEAEVIFLLSTYKELVDREAVGKQKELMVGTLRGVLRAKVEQLKSRAVPEIHFPPGWL